MRIFKPSLQFLQESKDLEEDLWRFHRLLKWIYQKAQTLYDWSQPKTQQFLHCWHGTPVILIPKHWLKYNCFKHHQLQDFMNKNQRHNTKTPLLKLLLLEIYENRGKFYLFHNYEATAGATVHNTTIYTNTDLKSQERNSPMLYPLSVNHTTSRLSITSSLLRSLRKKCHQ